MARPTRGLIELVSRLLRSVWDRKANDVFLIGPQHFDLAIPDGAHVDYLFHRLFALIWMILKTRRAAGISRE